MSGSLLLAVPILLPVLAAVPMLFCFKQQRKMRQIYLVAVLALSWLAVLAAVFAARGPLLVFHFSQRLPVFFQADGLGAFFCVLAATMFLLVGIFATEYMKHEENEERFYFFYLIVLGLLVGMGFSGNLLTLYFFFEVMTLCSMPLVLHTLSREAIAAAFKYLFYSIAGASLGLLGIFFVYSYGESLSFTLGGVMDAGLLAGHENALLAVCLLAVIGFGAKAGMFPLHAWLPTAHPVAPAPASAILSGVITKAGVFAIFRFIFYIVGPDLIRGSWMQYAWMTLALVTVFMGSTLAYKEPMLKKRLAYSSVSQVSYILFGLSTLSAGGVLGALLHMVFHSVAKDALFMIAGAIIYKTGKTQVSELVGIGKEMPKILWCFTLTSVAMVGIPPTIGFVSKWYLATGALSAGIGVFGWLGPVILLFSALLTAAYLFPITIRGFFPGAGANEAAPEKRDVSWAMGGPIVLLTAAGILLGIFASPLIGFFEGIVTAVL